ncbi:MAG: hypothetical protein LUC38_04310 [Oscillospiraceae bacterium]|nr:hypothetical protein [Oscillospiraceae bacterium]
MSTKKLLCILASVVLAVTLLTFGAVATEITKTYFVTDSTVAGVSVNGSNNGFYDSLQDAIDDAGTSTVTITLYKNTTESVTIASGQSITLDLAGYTITDDGDHTITNKGILYVTDSVGGGVVDNTTHGKGALVNYGEATLEAGTLKRSAETGVNSSTSGGNSWYTIKNYGYMEIDGATVVNSGYFSSCIASGYYDSSDKSAAQSITGTSVIPTLVINSGSISGGLNAVKNDDDAELVVCGGTITNTASDGCAIQNHSTATITGGSISATKYAVYNCGCSATSDVGVLSITDGSMSGTYAVADVSTANTAKVTITGGSLTGTTAAIATSSTSSAEITVAMTVSITGSTNLVAACDGIQYTSLDAALEAATSGSTVTLLADVEYDSNITVASGSSLTLDVGTYTLDLRSSQIGVSGTLTIEGTTGTITSTTSKGVALIQADGSSASVTLNGGNLVNETTNSYGIYCLNGGTAIVNDGSITSQSAALAGNNTTGDMNFEVNGGTLTAGDGAAIYMPGQVNLVITGGTLNGGISLRMGQVTITGGTIIAITDNIDDIASYYSYSGNVWLGDALYVMGGTHTSESSYGSSLVINISGGEFICNNDSGNAIAIYNLDKVAQTATVNITGGTFTSAGGAAYAVIDFSDLGVSNSSYGVSENVVTTEITGGTFTGSSVAVSISDSSVATTEISGGTYSHDVLDSYIKAGLDAVQLTSGVWVIGGTEAQITVSDYSNGTVTTDPTGTAVSGQTVTITAIPESSYYKANVKVYDATGAEVTVTTGSNNTYTFTMPSSAVTVSVSFVRVKDEISGIFYVNESYHGIMVNGHLLSIPHTVNEAGYCTTCGAYIGVEEEEVELEEEVTEEVVEVEDPVESGETDSEDDGEEAPAEAPVEEETNPTTGVALGLIPMAIAAVAVAVSKKH